MIEPHCGDGPCVYQRVGDWQSILGGEGGDASPGLVLLAGAGGAGVVTLASEFLGSGAAAVALVGVVVLGRAARSPFFRLRAPRRQCLRGVIEPHPRAFAAIGERDPVVYVRTVSHQSAGNDKGLIGVFRETVRAVPFHIRLADGRRAALEPPAVALVAPLVRKRSLSDDDRRALGAPTRGLRRWVQQAALRPGDAVEMIATARSIVHPAGEAAPGRGVPMTVELVPPSGFQIQLRPLR